MMGMVHGVDGAWWCMGARGGSRILSERFPNSY